MRHQTQYMLIMAAMLAGLGQAQAQPITVYSNDFETLDSSAPSCNAGGVGDIPGDGSVGGTFAADYSTSASPIAQVKTVDRICTQTAVSSSVYSDPNDPGNRYAGGLLANPIEDVAISFNYIETVGMVFDPQEHSTLNLSMQWSITNLQDGFGDYWPDDRTTAYVHTRYYKVPSDGELTLQDNSNNPADVLVDGVLALPAVTTQTSISRASFEPESEFVLDWRPQNDSIDLAGLGFDLTDKVGVVMHVSNATATKPIYMAFDNLNVTATDEPAEPSLTLNVAAATITTVQNAVFSGQVRNFATGDGVELEVRSGNVFVSSGTAVIGDDGRYSMQLGPFPIGTYQVTASLGGLTGSANFTVTADNVSNPGVPTHATSVPGLGTFALALLGMLMAAAAAMRKRPFAKN